jgi:isoleucyl-tRNA synthetase
MPFLAEHLWRRLVASQCREAPESVFLAGWPAAAEVDEALLAEVAEVRRVVELARSARAEVGIKLRQPLRELLVEGAGDGAARHADEIGGELRVKEVGFRPIEDTSVRAKPNLRLLGPRLGKAMPDVRRALAEGRFDQLEGGRISVLGHELGPEEVFVERTAPEGWTLAEDDGLLVALDTRLDPELELEGRVYDLIHAIQRLRKESGLEITDRIVLTIPEEEGELLDEHGEWITAETLAVRIELGPRLQVAKA